MNPPLCLQDNLVKGANTPAHGKCVFAPVFLKGLIILARFCSLFSSSNGNSIFVGTSEGSVLIDAGVSAKRIDAALEGIGESPENIRAVFVTHEHSDHISGLAAFALKHGIKVYCSKGTYKALSSKKGYEKVDFCLIDKNSTQCAGMNITPFHTAHDCLEGLGYVIETPDDRKIAIATDLGNFTDEIKEAVTGCDLVYIESNFDLNMLKNGPYPYFLKQRILSKHGHLSNDECAAAASFLMQNGTTRFVLGHLSEKNNLPSLAMNTTLSSLTEIGGICGKDFTLDVSPRLSPLKKILF